MGKKDLPERPKGEQTEAGAQGRRLQMRAVKGENQAGLRTVKPARWLKSVNNDD